MVIEHSKDDGLNIDLTKEHVEPMLQENGCSRAHANSPARRARQCQSHEVYLPCGPSKGSNCVGPYRPKDRHAQPRSLATSAAASCSTRSSQEDL